jgi:hypothetical protein
VRVRQVREGIGIGKPHFHPRQMFQFFMEESKGGRQLDRSAPVWLILTASLFSFDVRKPSGCSGSKMNSDGGHVFYAVI